MLHATRVVAVAMLFLAAIVPTATAQFTVSGTVTDMFSAAVDSVGIVLFDGGGFPIGIPPTMTDAVGAYSIIGLPPGSYVVGFEPPARDKLLTAEAEITIVASNVTANAQLQPGLLLSGFVRDTTGAGIFNIDLVVDSRDTGAEINTPGDNTDSTGFYDVIVPSGELDIKWRAVGAGALPWIPVIERVVITADTSIDVTMMIGVFVSGTVKDTFGAPVANVNLDFVDAATGVKLVTPGDNTDTLGTYQVHVPIALFDVVAKPRVADRLAAGEAFDVPVFADAVMDFVLEPGVSISGQVTDPFAAGVAGADIDVEDSVTGKDIVVPFDVTDLSGFYEVVVPVGQFDIAYQPPVATKLAPVEILAVSIGLDTVINVSAPNGVFLSGTVQTNLGVPVPGVDIDVKVPVTGVSVPISGDVTDALGMFTVVVAPSTYDVEVEPAKAGKLVPERFLSTSVLVDTNIPVTVFPGARVRGTVTDSVGVLMDRVNIDVFTIPGGVELFTPGDLTNSAGRYDVVVPKAMYRLVAKPDPLAGIPDSVVLDNEAIFTDRFINVEFGISLATGVRPAGYGTMVELHQNYPNPFNPSTSFDFVVREQTPVDLSVFDVAGRLVATLRRSELGAGQYTATWDGTNSRGEQVSSGVYFYRLRAGGTSITKKMLMLK